MISRTAHALPSHPNQALISAQPDFKFGQLLHDTAWCHHRAMVHIWAYAVYRLCQHQAAACLVRMAKYTSSHTSLVQLGTFPKGICVSTCKPTPHGIFAGAASATAPRQRGIPFTLIEHALRAMLFTALHHHGWVSGTPTAATTSSPQLQWSQPHHQLANGCTSIPNSCTAEPSDDDIRACHCSRHLFLPATFMPDIENPYLIRLHLKRCCWNTQNGHLWPRLEQDGRTRYCLMSLTLPM
ncbi:hypothetical protein BASA60_003168 [Batrachochytrium salamandrivorans]|nr:hypothetical protein BASA60_003168 [Batrachochytrium salamandrivorans]